MSVPPIPKPQAGRSGDGWGIVAGSGCPIPSTPARAKGFNESRYGCVSLPPDEAGFLGDPGSALRSPPREFQHCTGVGDESQPPLPPIFISELSLENVEAFSATLASTRGDGPPKWHPTENRDQTAMLTRFQNAQPPLPSREFESRSRRRPPPQGDLSPPPHRHVSLARLMQGQFRSCMNG